MTPYAFNQLVQEVAAQRNQLDRIEDLLQIVSRHILQQKVTELKAQKAPVELSPDFPAANQPEEGDQAQPETTEPVSESAGNTQTVGSQRVGAPE